MIWEWNSPSCKSVSVDQNPKLCRGPVVKTINLAIMWALHLIVTIAVDVITIERTGENFRLIYDVKGRFAVHRITPEEAKVRGVV